MTRCVKQWLQRIPVCQPVHGVEPENLRTTVSRTQKVKSWRTNSRRASEAGVNYSMLSCHPGLRTGCLRRAAKWTAFRRVEEI